VIKEIGYKGEEWIQLAQDGASGRLFNTVMKLLVP
jgi:hypothetical protein